MKTTTTKAERIARYFESMASLGFSTDEAVALRRIEMTLHRWAEHECNGNIQRDGDDGEGKPRWYYGGGRKGRLIPDRERGALKRLHRIVGNRNTRNWIGFGGPIDQSPGFIRSYVQGDPRGCALYLVKNEDLRGADIHAAYSRGFAVCY